MQLERLTAEDLANLGGPAAVARHLRALVPSGASVEAEVREITEHVRAQGDQAVLELTRRLDTDGAPPLPLLVAAPDLDEAIKRLPLDLVAGLQVAIANVAEVAQAGSDGEQVVPLPQGQRITVREVPVARAAVYVPGGRAPYPSTVVMGVVAARAAGVLDVVVCSPPGRDREIDGAVLGTCRLCGVERVYRMGGAQAIAALAFGTETVQRADVVVGPGNLYVQEAKRMLSASIGSEGYAGPSDLLVVLGAHAGARELRLAALDLLAQGEHGEGSIVVGVACSARVGDELAGSLEALARERSGRSGARFALVEAADEHQALALANAFAPEHLQLVGAEVEALAPRATAAGCVFVGAGSATAFGDYVAGSNHILPTAGAARFGSGLSPHHFRRRVAEVQIDERAAAKLAGAGVPIARAEGFEWHARSMEARIGDN